MVGTETEPQIRLRHKCLSCNKRMDKQNMNPKIYTVEYYSSIKESPAICDDVDGP